MDYTRMSSKGQIVIPREIRDSLKLEDGQYLAVSAKNDFILLKKVKVEDFSDLLKHSEDVAKKLWDNDEDEVWNSV